MRNSIRNHAAERARGPTKAPARPDQPRAPQSAPRGRRTSPKVVSGSASATFAATALAAIRTARIPSTALTNSSSRPLAALEPILPVATRAAARRGGFSDGLYPSFSSDEAVTRRSERRGRKLGDNAIRENGAAAWVRAVSQLSRLSLIPTDRPRQGRKLNSTCLRSSIISTILAAPMG